MERLNSEHGTMGRLLAQLAERKAWEAANNSPLCKCHNQGLAAAWTEAMREDAEREYRVEVAHAMARASVSIPDKLKGMGVPVAVLEHVRNPKDTPAMKAARRYFEPNEPRWLLLLGPCSTGKTLAGAWILGQWQAKHAVWTASTGQRAETGLFVAAAEFSGASDYREDDKAWLQRLTRCGLLVLDDLGTERMGDIELGLIQRLLLARHASGARTIITSNLSAEQFGERYGERVVERIREVGRVVGAGNESLRKKGAK